MILLQGVLCPGFGGFVGQEQLKLRSSQAAMGGQLFNMRGLISLTLGSAITPGVSTNTTFWTNFMQHILKPIGAVSIRFRMLDLMDDIVCQLSKSFSLVILRPVNKLSHEHEAVILTSA